ncbi:MAG: ATP phosphoribosyltransferase [Candidatus Nanopelagicales bacterium]
MLKVAIPNKGQLSEPAKAILREAGYLKSAHPRDLVVVDPINDVEFFFLRPRDVALYVERGTLDAGITGIDLLIDSGAKAEQLLQLGFGSSQFFLAAPKAGSIKTAADLAGKRIATSYEKVLRNYLNLNKIEAEIVSLDGAVENAIRLGVADAVADVVDTGTTIAQAGLELIGDPILSSEAVLIKNVKTDKSEEINTLVRRLSSVLVARTYVMLDYDILENLIEEAASITPGIESPTISPLHEKGWVAVRALVKKDTVHIAMDQLYQLGARGILVTEIAACRL